MKTLYVHPAQMKRIISGNCNQPIITRYEGFSPGDVVEVVDLDDVQNVRTKVKSVTRISSSLFKVTIEDPAIAFVDYEDTYQESPKEK